MLCEAIICLSCVFVHILVFNCVCSHLVFTHLVFVLGTIYILTPRIFFSSSPSISTLHSIFYNKLNSQAGQVPPTSHYIPSIMNGHHIPLIMIVHGIQVPQAKVASLAPLIGVPASLGRAEAAHRGHPVVRVGSQVVSRLCHLFIRIRYPYSTRLMNTHLSLVSTLSSYKGIIPTIIVAMMIGLALAISLNGIHQTVRVGRAIVAASYVRAL